MADNDDPFVRPDATMLRPRPGAGKRGWNDPARSRAAAPVSERGADLRRGARPARHRPQSAGAGGKSAAAADRPVARRRVTPMDVPGLRRHALDEIRRFEDQARSAGVPNEIVLAARYALCAGLDEAVLSTPWGAQSEWAQHPLLVALHREAWGGEKFFEMLDRISGDPARHIDLMELQYLGLAFGFAGKYQVMDRGHEHLAKVQQRPLSQDPGSSRRRRARAVAAVARAARIGGIRSFGTCRGGSSARRRVALLAVTFTVVLRPPGGLRRSGACRAREGGPRRTSRCLRQRPPRAGPTLKQLLAADERDGTLSVEENGGRTTVTLLAPDLFASGSAAVNPAQFGTLQRLAKALEQRSGPRAGRRPHRRSTGQVAALPGQLRAVARARGERREGPAAGDRQSGPD